MWVAFFTVYQFLQKIAICRVEYDPVKERFVENRNKNYKYWWVNSQISLVCIMSAGRMVYYIRTDRSKTGLTFMDFVIDLFFWTITFLQNVCVWTFWKRKQFGAWFLNQTMARRQLKGNLHSFQCFMPYTCSPKFLIEPDFSDKKFDLMTVMLYSLVGLFLLCPVVIAALPFIFKSTVIHDILNIYLPDTIMENPTFAAIACSLYLAIHALLGEIPISLTLCLIMIAVYEAQYFLKPAFILRKSNSIGRPKLTTFKIIFPRAVKCYRIGYLIWEALMSYGTVLFPSLMMTAYFLNVVTTFACLKLHHELHPVVLVMLGAVDILCLANTVTLHFFALVICHDFERFYQFWKGKLLAKRYRKLLKACIPIRVKIGSFFPLKSSTILATMQEIVNMTMTLLLV